MEKTNDRAPARSCVPTDGSSDPTRTAVARGKRFQAKGTYEDAGEHRTLPEAWKATKGHREGLEKPPRRDEDAARSEMGPRERVPG